jgi:hypothetical protein
MRNGCCCNCYYKVKVKWFTYHHKSVKMEVGDACMECNNVFFQPKGSRRIHLIDR